MALRGAMPADVMKAVTSFDWRILVLAVYPESTEGITWQSAASFSPNPPKG